MADRELLEAAAKAAGVEGHFCAKKELDTELWGIVTFLGYGQAAFWNPLENDGDALRLAVKLCLQVRIEDYGTSARPISKLPEAWVGCETHKMGGDHAAATRRAIVRAAASIGSSGEREGDR